MGELIQQSLLSLTFIKSRKMVQRTWDIWEKQFFPLFSQRGGNVRVSGSLLPLTPQGVRVWDTPVGLVSCEYILVQNMYIVHWLWSV
jgi:hypothetical protein